ncbi:DnaJ sub B member 13 [Blyttiomyces sp. JEL0837]|nr:DnaJ sub B member 13 [Blyttiomyces sp. JEL0837]
MAAGGALLPDFYKTLGLDRSADTSSVKKAYRKLALKYHPEKNSAPDAFEYFKRIAEAYDVLSNHKYRAIYDQYGNEGLKNGVPPRDGFEGFSGGYAYHGNPEETFAQFFGGKNPFADFFAVLTEDLPSPTTTQSPFPSKFGQKFGGMHGMNHTNAALSPPAQDPNVEKDLELTLEELYNGTVKKVKMIRKILGDDGVTTVEDEKVFVIDVCKGWKEGTKIRFPGEGDQGPNKLPADIIFIVREQKHDRFVRRGNDLIYNSRITLGKALTGNIVTVETLDGRTLQIPVNDVV